LLTTHSRARLRNHVTDVDGTEREDGTVGVGSKGIGVNTDGTMGRVTYEDTVFDDGRGWRISYRRSCPGAFR
jgi:hypothetical protein